MRNTNRESRFASLEIADRVRTSDVIESRFLRSHRFRLPTATGLPNAYAQKPPSASKISWLTSLSQPEFLWINLFAARWVASQNLRGGFDCANLRSSCINHTCPYNSLIPVLRMNSVSPWTLAKKRFYNHHLLWSSSALLNSWTCTLYKESYG